MTKTVARRLTMAMLLLAFIAISSSKAQAAPVFTTFSCTQGIQDIVWDGGGLYIDCIGQPNRFAAFTFSPCAGMGAQSVDTIKLFQSLAESAMISGKLLVITYATPASCTASVGAIGSLTLSR